ncbi:membrane associated rhomboid family serine protease [Bartonella silvatica]|uniref:Membrane associated rhomboid family serine protease n=2 Tax=Bartonella silvatica TaxID=357760 RepID=A0ABV2HHS6_9HYPH
MHSSFQHVAINMAWLLVFGSPLVKHLGVLRFLIFWIVTAIIAVLTYFVFHQDSAVPLVGASGVVSGMMGAIARYGFPPVVGIGTQNKEFLSPLLSIKKALRTGNVLIFMGVWLGVDVIMGVYSFLLVGEGVSIAWEAHIGGFCSGFLLIGFFDISRQKINIMV